MSVTVTHLNADSSFLLRFSSEPEPSASNPPPPHATYTVLIDPWLLGDSIVTHPWFAVTKHNIPSAIRHLSEIDEPDLVIVSQNKPDHCHGETLRQLTPGGKTIFAAEPGAAKAIKSWNYFDPARVFGLPKYNPRKRFSLLRFHIPPLAPGGDPGEVTIAFIPARNYMTGLHNGIGLTYQAPTAAKTLARVCTVDLPRQQQAGFPFSPCSLPPNSPAMPLTPHRPRPRTADGSYSHTIDSVADSEPQSYHEDDDYHAITRPNDTTNEWPLSPPFSPASKMTFQSIPDAPLLQHPLTPPESPSASVSPSTTARTTPTATNLHTPASSFSLPPTAKPQHLTLIHSNTPSSTIAINNTPTYPARPRPLSLLYTPHGISLSDITPYTQHHLVPSSALPLTLLLHSFSRATNPWYLGGNIMAGSLNGVEIARALMARVWLSAHDEVKDDRGFSVRRLRVEGRGPEEVRKMLYYAEKESSDRKPGRSHDREDSDAEKWRKFGWGCDIRDLGVGKSMVIGSGERDLVEGAEKRWRVGTGVDGC